jgi:hypothetical protein
VLTILRGRLSNHFAAAEANLIAFVSLQCHMQVYETAQMSIDSCAQSLLAKPLLQFWTAVVFNESIFNLHLFMKNKCIYNRSTSRFSHTSIFEKTDHYELSQWDIHVVGGGLPVSTLLQP